MIELGNLLSNDELFNDHIIPNFDDYYFGSSFADLFLIAFSDRLSERQLEKIKSNFFGAPDPLHFKKLFFSKLPSEATLSLYTSSSVFSKHLLELDSFSIQIDKDINKSLDSCNAPAYVDMENGTIYFEPALIYESIKDGLFNYLLNIFVSNAMRHQNTIFTSYQSLDYFFSEAALNVFSFLFYHEISHLIYSPFSSRSFKDMVSSTLSLYSQQGITEPFIYRMSNYASDLYDEEQFKFDFSKYQFASIIKSFDIGRYFMRGNKPVIVTPEQIQDQFEFVQYKTLMERFTFTPEMYNEMTRRVFYEVLSNHKDVISRHKDYFSIVMSYLPFNYKFPEKPPESFKEPFISPGDEEGSERIDVELLVKDLVNTPPGYDFSTSSLNHFKSIQIPQVLQNFYDTLSSSFTDEWRDYLTKQDAPLDGFLSGKFDFKHAHKVALTPRVFTKQLAFRRESDLRVKIAIDFSGSMYNDLRSSRRRTNKVSQDIGLDSNDLFSIDRFDLEKIMDFSERLVSSSLSYVSIFAFVLGEVFSRAENKVDYSFFSNEVTLVEPFVFVKDNLPLFLDLAFNDLNSGRGTNVSTILSYYTDTFSFVPNKDRLVIILTDGAFGESAEVLETISRGSEIGIFYLFVGIGISFSDNLISSNVHVLDYANGNDMAVRFPADFSAFINNKYFTEV
jgi:hypothetical protein